MLNAVDYLQFTPLHTRVLHLAHAGPVPVGAPSRDFLTCLLSLVLRSPYANVMIKKFGLIRLVCTCKCACTVHVLKAYVPVHDIYAHTHAHVHIMSCSSCTILILLCSWTCGFAQCTLDSRKNRNFMCTEHQQMYYIHQNTEQGQSVTVTGTQSNRSNVIRQTWARRPSHMM